ncbi:MAG TPA: IS481 family transposase [Sporichthyaceae bacterium]|nr:IS481 family transposase [Sporichthyaceae bacterium]
MLVELDVVEQRYRAVLEVLDGASVTDVARRYSVARQTVHGWLRRYGGAGGLSGLADRSSRPNSCPHQMSAAVEATVVAMRREHPGWGPATILWHLQRQGVEPLPGRSSVHRALLRHGLVDARKRRRRREDYRRWERERSMELWQMDVMGRLFLSEGTETKVITGIDDHSRFVVCAKVVVRATARPVCEALVESWRVHGVPEAILTDNGKVFTGRFGRGAGEVLFDRICRENGVRHLLTAPRSPTTTGKIERFHKTLRKEFALAHDRVHGSVEELQEALDGWVREYNTARPHQSIGARPPVERFTVAARPGRVVEVPGITTAGGPVPARRPGGVSRWVDPAGHISLASFRYFVGASFAGQPVEVVVTDGVVQVLHAGVLVATHAQRLKPDHHDRRPHRALTTARAREATTGLTVTRIADNSGNVSFAGASYGAGRRFARQNIDVTIVAASMQLSQGGKVIRVHPIRHDRSRELGAFANPKGRPRRKNQSA